MRTLYKFLRAGVVSALFVQVGFAQKENVGIGTTKPDQSAILDLSSTNKGLLMPRVSLQQRNSIQNPANGLIVYQTDMLSGFYYFDGKEWKSVGAETSQNSVADAFNWGLTGNAGTLSTSFLGTTDAQPLRIRVNNQKAGLIDQTGSSITLLGYQAGNGLTSGQYNTAFGYQAMLNNSAGQNNVAVGNGAMLGVTGSNNIGMGANVLHGNGVATGGNDNVAIGHFVGFKNTTGNRNVGVGSSALFNNTSGTDNLAVGTFAMENSGTGTFNVAIGSSALRANTAGSNNMALGANALSVNTGSENVAVGAQALSANAGGTGNIAIGNGAGQNETGSSKLYIANSNTATPLVYGDFSTKYLAVGEVAAADRAAATSGGYRLLVKGGMITEKIKVAVAGSADWADYVFEPTYKLMTLDKVESFVKENKHLPNVPSAEEMSKNGLDVMQTSAKLMEKVEELTLYIIELNKEIQALKKQNAQK